ncbi:MAG TPA: luciferase family protein [Solirubrobacterales bacterium]|nr:luciferase family protein [Solirubrobacterales bacterium]
MNETKTPSQTIIDEVTTWPGVTTEPGRFGALAFKLERREIGHLHGDHAAHFAFPKELKSELKNEGRVQDHPLGEKYKGLAARRIDDEHDVWQVIELLRLNYDRAVDRVQLPSTG